MMINFFNVFSEKTVKTLIFSSYFLYNLFNSIDKCVWVTVVLHGKWKEICRKNMCILEEKQDFLQLGIEMMMLSLQRLFFPRTPVNSLSAVRPLEALNLNCVFIVQKYYK